MLNVMSTPQPTEPIPTSGPPPSERHGTRSEFGNPSPMYTSDVKAIWRYAFDKSANLQRGVVTLSVTPPADAPVGKYSLSAKTERGKTSLGTLVVLFNPWCSDDWVYLPDERERQEYVMNEYGIVCVGTSHSIAGRPWDFGQFEEEMVDICLKLLDVNPKYLRDPADDVSARCNPIYVSRVISAMINSNGDQGVLVGRWHGDYSDGVTPTRWTGSVDILQKWCKLNCHPVKYGQCWVFATVMCSVMRFFGIPCRVVTNFESAHDENNSLTIDRVYNKYGMKGAEESIWNFHVWVEGWMKRPDLMKGTAYDGWQVLDPTPQELSEGTHCCGPAPVSGILQGEVNLKYDTPFVFSEVNADIIKWMESDNGSRRKIYSDTTRVGRNISTKAVGRYMRDDITNSYKHREGSKDERAVFDRAMCRVNSKDDEDENRPVLKVDMKIEEETKIVSGQDIKLKLKLRSKDRTNRKMDIYINAQAMRYNGITTSNIHNSLQVQEILAGTDVIIPIQIPFSKYGRYMVGCDSMKVSVMAVDQQQQDDIFETETDIVLEGSPIIIKVHGCAVGEARLYQMLTITVEFENPLNETLKNCSLTVTGTGLFKSNYVEGEARELPPGKTLKLTISTTPYRAGLRTLVADFDCNCFRDIKGTCTILVNH